MLDISNVCMELNLKVESCRKQAPLVLLFREQAHGLRVPAALLRSLRTNRRRCGPVESAKREGGAASTRPPGPLRRSARWVQVLSQQRAAMEICVASVALLNVSKLSARSAARNCELRLPQEALPVISNLTWCPFVLFERTNGYSACLLFINTCDFHRVYSES